MGCAFYSDCKTCLDVRNCDIKAKLDEAVKALDNIKKLAIGIERRSVKEAIIAEIKTLSNIERESDDKFFLKSCKLCGHTPCICNEPCI